MALNLSEDTIALVGLRFQDANTVQTKRPKRQKRKKEDKEEADKGRY